MYNNDLDGKVSLISISETVPVNNSTVHFNYPTGVSNYNPITGYSVALPSGTIQHNVPGIFIYSNGDDWQITTYGLDSQYEGLTIYVYFVHN